MNAESVTKIAIIESRLLEVLEQLIPECPAGEVRSLLHQASRNLTDELETGWDRWVTYVCTQTGRHAQPVFGSVEQLFLFLEAGSRVICQTQDSSEGIHFLSLYQSGRFISFNQGKPVTIAQARKMIKSTNSSNDPLHFVVIESGSENEHSIAHLSENSESHHDHHESPVRMLWNLLRPEWSDLGIVLLFALVIGILSLTIPIAVEALVDTVAFGRFLQPVIILSAILFGFLGFNALLLGLQTYVVEIIQRRLFARLAGEISMKLPRVIQSANSRDYLPETINRFLDIVTIQKSTASLVIGGTSIALSTLIGMAVLAFYHPWLLGFDLVLLALIGLIIFVLGRGAIRTSIEESRMKYSTLAWFEDVARCPMTFRNREALQFCIDQANALTGAYLIARENHFRIVFRQFGFVLLTQVLASTVLLGLGGWLVISGQLTLGQLVAAELIVTVILGSFAKLGKKLESFYDLVTAVDKVNILQSLPVEAGKGEMFSTDSTTAEGIIIQSVEHPQIASGTPVNDILQSGELVLIEGGPGTGKSLLLRLMFGMESPRKGYLQYCGKDLRHLQLESLRSRMYLLADVEVFAGTIRSNLMVGAEAGSGESLNSLLKSLNLLHVILSLPQGLDTELSASGAPLSTTHLKLLMVVRCLLRDPHVIGFDAFLDSLPIQDIHRVLDLCQQRSDRVIVIASNHPGIHSRVRRKLCLDGNQSKKSDPDSQSPNDVSHSGS